MSTISKTVVTVQLSNGGWAMRELDTISRNGGYWLVPGWTPSPDGRSRQPARIVSMTMVETGAPVPDVEDFRGLPIPEVILSMGTVPLSLARLFLVEELPDVWVENAEG